MLRELVAAAILLSIAWLYYRAASGIQQSALADEVGPGGVPIAYAVALGALALTLALRALFTHWVLRAPSAGLDAEQRLDRRMLTRALGMLGIGVAYLALVPVLGYAVTAGLVILTVAVYQGERPDARLLAIGVGGALFFWAFFVVLLGIDMPAGFWPLLWGGDWTR